MAPPERTRCQQYMCVNSTDRFYAVLTTCDPDFNTIELDVAITAKSTYGMLPGELYGLLQYFRVMVCVLLALGAVWCALVLRHRHTLLHVHHWITVVLLLAIVEACFRLIDLSIFNITGGPPRIALQLPWRLTPSRAAVRRAECPRECGIHHCPKLQKGCQPCPDFDREHGLWHRPVGRRTNGGRVSVASSLTAALSARAWGGCCGSLSASR